MLGEPENQFSLTRAALSTSHAKKQLPYYDYEGFVCPISRFSRHNIVNLSHPEQSLALMATTAKTAGGDAEGELRPAKPVPSEWAIAPAPIVHPVVFATIIP